MSKNYSKIFRRNGPISPKEMTLIIKTHQAAVSEGDWCVGWGLEMDLALLFLNRDVYMYCYDYHCQSLGVFCYKVTGFTSDLKRGVKLILDDGRKSVSVTAFGDEFFLSKEDAVSCNEESVVFNVVF